jgi:hypothetical protein
MSKETIPYTYLLKNKTTGMFYYGVQYNKHAHPKNFWTTYFTSSNVVKEMIEKYGLEDWEYEIRKIFKTTTAALKWETTVLRRINALFHPKFLNKSNGYWNNADLRWCYCIQDHSILKMVPKDTKLPEGWDWGEPNISSRMQGNNYTKGYKWIKNINDSTIGKMIPKDQHIPTGFECGRPTTHIKNSTKGYRWVHEISNPWNHFQIKLNESLPDGFAFGIGQHKEHCNNHVTTKGKLWANNGIEHLFVDSSEIPEGFIKGRLNASRGLEYSNPLEAFF